MAHPLCPCCHRGPNIKNPAVHRSRTFSSLEEAKVERNKPWFGDVEANVWTYEGQQPQVPPKPYVSLFTHRGYNGCDSTRVRHPLTPHPKNVGRQ